MTLFYKVQQLFTTVTQKANILKPVLVGLKEKKVILSSNVIDIEQGNGFIRTGISGYQTFSITNANKVEDDAIISFTLVISTIGATAITWWPGIKWNSGVIPDLTQNGRDTFGFISYDKGVTWDGYIMSKDSK